MITQILAFINSGLIVCDQSTRTVPHTLGTSTPGSVSMMIRLRPGGKTVHDKQILTSKFIELVTNILEHKKGKENAHQTMDISSNYRNISKNPIQQAWQLAFTLACSPLSKVRWKCHCYRLKHGRIFEIILHWITAARQLLVLNAKKSSKHPSAQKHYLPRCSIYTNSSCKGDAKWMPNGCQVRSSGGW